MAQSNRVDADWSTGQRLERYMYDHGWTRYAIQQATGIDKSTLSRMCRGDEIGSLANWRRVAAAMGATVDEIANYGMGSK